MTTIVFRSGILAFDSKISEDSLGVGKMVKGVLTKNFMAAAAGDAQDVQAFLDWVASGFKPEDKKQFGLADRDVEVEAIVIDSKGNVLIFEGRLYPYKMEAPYYALGSGSEVALGALAMGASAYAAVKVASSIDANTGGEVRTLSFHKHKSKKKKVSKRNAPKNP